MKVAVIGTGSVGGYFGGKLAGSLEGQSDAEIYLLARKAHLE